jgi:hypothetical protein
MRIEYLTGCRGGSGRPRRGHTTNQPEYISPSGVAYMKDNRILLPTEYRIRKTTSSDRMKDEERSSKQQMLDRIAELQKQLDELTK